MPKLPSGEQKLLRRFRDRAHARQGGLCHWCARSMNKGAPDSDPLQTTGDHLIPLYAGGRTKPGNIVAACRECNNRRNPETDRGPGGLVASAGDPTVISPFACLRP